MKLTEATTLSQDQALQALADVIVRNAVRVAKQAAKEDGEGNKGSDEWKRFVYSALDPEDFEHGMSYTHELYEDMCDKLAKKVEVKLKRAIRDLSAELL